MYNSIIKGLTEAIDFEKGDLAAAKSKKIQISPLPHFTGGEIREIRLNQKFTQQSFASIFGVSTKTIEAWESGRNTPLGPAQRILELLSKDQNLLEKYEILKR